MARVRFDGRGRLTVYGHDLRGGEVAEMTDAQAEALAAHPHIPVTILGVVTHHADGTSTRSAAATTSKTKKRRTTKQEE